MLDDLEEFEYPEGLDAWEFERFQVHIQEAYSSTSQRQRSDMAETDDVLDPRRLAGLRRTEEMCNVELSCRERKRIHIEQTCCYQVCDGERTTLMILQSTVHRVAVIGEEGANAFWSFTWFQRDTLEASLVHAERSLVVDGVLHTVMCFVEPSFVLGRFAPVLEDYVKAENSICPGRQFCKHLQQAFW